jgi:hypothetical protein
MNERWRGIIPRIAGGAVGLVGGVGASIFFHLPPVEAVIIALGVTFIGAVRRGDFTAVAKRF